VSSDRAALNASPIITLCKSGQEDLLPQLFTEIVLPGAVLEEVEAGDITNPAAQKLGALTWLKRDDTVAVAPIVQAWDLGAGETVVLSYALARPDYVAVIDDTAGRRCASSLNITVIGTVGLIVLAKRRKLIARITPSLEALRDAGLWLSDKLLEQLKQQEGE
jgi:predicted nucleic acid-binding protein